MLVKKSRFEYWSALLNSLASEEQNSVLELTSSWMKNRFTIGLVARMV